MLSKEQVREIRRRYGSKKATQTELAKIYGVGVSAISRIVTGKRWAA